jgi:hypothetical protein
MTDKQPEALRLADEFDTEWKNVERCVEAAAELRRLHEVNAELVKALRILVDYYASPIARDAIRKATGEQQ